MDKEVFDNEIYSSLTELKKATNQNDINRIYAKCLHAFTEITILGLGGNKYEHEKSRKLVLDIVGYFMDRDKYDNNNISIEDKIKNAEINIKRLSGFVEIHH